MAVTKLENLINPEVIADFVEQKLVDAIKFAPLCSMSNELVGKAGDTLSLPKMAYIGDADSVLEGEPIPVSSLESTMEGVRIHKIGKGVGFTDEAELSGLADGSLGTVAVNQIVTSIASRTETEIIAKMQEARLSYTYASAKDAAENVAAALELFGEDMDGQKVLVIPPSLYTTFVGAKGWIPNTEMGANILVKGTVGQIMGCDIVVSNRLANAAAKDEYVLTSDGEVKEDKEYYTRSGSTFAKVDAPESKKIATYFEKITLPQKQAFIVKPGALKLLAKRGVMVEFDRDAQTQQDFIFGSKLYAPYLYDESKIVKIAL